MHEPESHRAKENKRLLELIRDSYNPSHGIYGSKRIHCDLQKMDESCSENRVARLMKQAGIKAILDYTQDIRLSIQPDPHRII